MAVGRRTRRGLVLAIALAGGLALPELVVRALGIEPVRNPVLRGRPYDPSPDPVLEFAPIPGARVALDFHVETADRPRWLDQSFNAAGYRGPVVAVPKPEGTLRVLCVGDSHTFGSGIGVDEAWPAQLARRLRAADGRRLEFVNGGVPAYDTAQEVRWLELHGERLEPDVVLLQYYVNDTASRAVERGDVAAPGFLFALSHPTRGGVVGWLRDRSRAADVALDALHRRRGLALKAAGLAREHADGAPGFERVKAALRRARFGLDAADVEFAVVLFPFLVREGDGFASRPAHAAVAAVCAAEGIPVFDGEPALLASGRPAEALRIAPGDVHANAEANALFGAALAAWLPGFDARFAPAAGAPENSTR